MYAEGVQLLPREMSAGVLVPERIVEHVAVAIQGLRVGEALHQCIRADKPPYCRIVVPGTIVVQAGARVQPLAGEKVLAGLSFGAGGLWARCGHRGSCRRKSPAAT